MKRQPPRRAAFPHSLGLLLPLVAVSGLAALPAPVAHAVGKPRAASVPYRSGTSGCHTFRIPAAVATPDGTLLAFAEGRRHITAESGGHVLYSGPADPGTRRRMEIRASPGNGRTWQRLWTVSVDPAGYSDLVQRTPSEAGLLYESGTADSRETIANTPLSA